jgi:prepilin peptidase CpaA
MKSDCRQRMDVPEERFGHSPGSFSGGSAAGLLKEALSLSRQSGGEAGSRAESSAVQASFVLFFLVAVFPLAMAYAAVSDLTTMTISNRLVLVLVVAFLALTPATGMSWQAFGMHWLAAAVVLFVAFAFFARGWIGGGDAKFCAAVALWVGWGSLLEYLVVAAVFGGALTMMILSYRRSVLPAFVTRQPWLMRLHDEKAGVPYGVALAAAGLWVYPDSIWMKVVTG